MEAGDRVEALLGHTRDVVGVVDAGGTIQYANAAVERVLGRDPDALVGTDAREGLHPDDRAAVADAFDRVRGGDAAEATVEHRYRAADGSWVSLETTVSGRDRAAVGGYVVAARPISRPAEPDGDRGVRDRLELLADHTDDVLWMFTADWGELLFVNAAYEAVWGRPVEALYEDPTDFMTGVHPDDRVRVRRAMRRLSRGEAVELEFRVNPDEDFRRRVAVTGSPVVEDGEVVRVVGCARDVTEVREHGRQLEVMERVLRHNLNNDMNVVLGYAEKAREGAPPEVAADLETALRRGEALLETVAKQRRIVEVLDPDPTREVVDLVPVVRELADAEAAANPGARIDLDLPDAAEVLALEEVDAAVAELLDNALDHSGERPRVTVSVTVREETVLLAVADEGPGIPEQEIGVLTGEREIEPLFHGSGLGLWLVNWIVRRSGGELDFERREPRGSRVTVCLERAVETGRDPTRRGELPAGSRSR